MKKVTKTIEAVPSKRMYRSIIADYNPKLAICELVDNSIDLWTREGKTKNLQIEVEVNTDQQSIRIIDNAGGIKEEDIKLIIAPGYSSTNPDSETIGVFGVGSKRAVVALAQNIKILTRHKNETTLLIEYDDNWFKREGWDIDYTIEPNNIPPNSTIIDLTKLRSKIGDGFESELVQHLAVTYSKIITNPKLTLLVNKKVIEPKHFDLSWSYPPNFHPQRHLIQIDIDGEKPMNVEILAGLVSKEQVGEGEYGVYFYCNNRLILRADKSYNLGFSSGQAGLPHPKFNMVRVFVYMTGNPERMPWNSSKSGINFQDKIFLDIRERVIQLVIYFCKLASKFSNNTDENIYQYSSGEISETKISGSTPVKLYPLPAPTKRPTFESIVREKNATVAEKKTWVIGLFEGVILADEIFNSNFTNKNRFVTIILDSTLEIAFKEYLVHVISKKASPPIGNNALTNLLQNRTHMEGKVKSYLGARISASDWNLLDHYYKMRCDLIHLKSTFEPKDNDVLKHKGIVEKVLGVLFSLKF